MPIDRDRLKLQALWCVGLLLALGVLAVSLVVSFWISMYAAAAVADGWWPVWGETPGDFPVVVYTPVPGADPAASDWPRKGVCNAVEWVGLPYFLSSHKTYTYLLPPGGKCELTSESHLEATSLEVKPLGEGRQRIVVQFWKAQDTYGGLYDATDKSVIPKSHRMIAGGPLVFAGYIIMGVLGSVLINLTGVGVLAWRRVRYARILLVLMLIAVALVLGVIFVISR